MQIAAHFCDTQLLSLHAGMLRYRTLVNSPLKYAEPAPGDGPGLWGVVSYLNLEPQSALHVSEFKEFYKCAIDDNEAI